MPIYEINNYPKCNTSDKIYNFATRCINIFDNFPNLECLPHLEILFQVMFLAVTLIRVHITTCFTLFNSRY